MARTQRQLGATRIRSTTYHPQYNDPMIKLFHRMLKGAMQNYGNTKWTKSLPDVFLGLRTAFKGGIHASSAQLVYGIAIRLLSDTLTTDVYKPSSCNTLRNMEGVTEY